MAVEVAVLTITQDDSGDFEVSMRHDKLVEAEVVLDILEQYIEASTEGEDAEPQSPGWGRL